MGGSRREQLGDCFQANLFWGQWRLRVKTLQKVRMCGFWLLLHTNNNSSNWGNDSSFAFQIAKKTRTPTSAPVITKLIFTKPINSKAVTGQTTQVSPVIAGYIFVASCMVPFLRGWNANWVRYRLGSSWADFHGGFLGTFLFYTAAFWVPSKKPGGPPKWHLGVIIRGIW